MNKTKELRYEILRVIAICCVIFNHTGDNGFFRFTVTDNIVEYMISMLLAIFCKVGVPIFFMISGALLIPKEEDLTTLLKKRILRIVVAIVLFSFVLYVRQYLHHPEYGFGISYFIKYIYSQPFVTPYWFLYSYLAILLLLPFLRKMARNMSKNDYLYFMVLVILFQCFIPIFNYFYGANLNINLFICESSVAFFLLGYGMDYVCDLSVYTKRGCYILQLVAFVSIILSGFMVYIDYKRSGGYTENFISVFVTVQAVTLYYCMKYWCRPTEKTLLGWLRKMIIYMGSCTFGIYLLEEILRTDIECIFGYLCPPLPSLIVCVIYIILVMCVGTLSVSILKKIPGLKKLL